MTGTWTSRSRAAGIHFLVSLAVAVVAAWLVFVVWYPGAFRALAGGRDLFFLVMSVDVVMGPVLTFVAFNPAKRKAELRRDLAVIALLQATALVYGLHTVAEVRPVAMVFEVDRMRLVTAVDVYREELDRAPPEYRSLPWTGPWQLGTREPQSGAERNESIFLGLKGIDRSQRPPFWQPYASSQPEAIRRSRPISGLSARYPARATEIAAALRGLGADPASARFLPAVARGDWVAVLSSDGSILGYVPFDGFF